MDDLSLDAAFVSAPIVLSTVGGLLLVLLSSTAKVPVTYAGALIVAATPVAGPAAAVGGVAAVLIHDLFRGAVGYWTVGIAVWVFAFAGLVAWLGPAPSRRGRPSGSLWRAVPAFLGAVAIAGVFSAAGGAWVVTVFGGGRFYTTAAGLLSGVPVAAAVGVLVLVITARRSRSDDGIDAIDAASPVSMMAGKRAPRSLRQPDRPTVWTAIGLFVVGVGWLGGAMVLDIVAHDLALFRTERELIRYAVDLFGSGSPAAAAASGLLVGIYRYGEAAVLLSAPVVALVAGGVYRWGTGPEADFDR